MWGVILLLTFVSLATQTSITINGNINQPSTEWQKVNPKVGLDRILGFASNDNGVLVMIQKTDYVNEYNIEPYYSTDGGNTWTQGLSSPAPYTLTSIQSSTFFVGGNFYVFVGNTTFTSADGINWKYVGGISDTLREPPALVNNNGNPLFVALNSNYSGTYVSTDGANWSFNQFSFGQTVFAAIYNTNNLFIVSGYDYPNRNYTYYATSDGVNWNTWGINSLGISGHSAEFFPGNGNEIVALVFPSIFNTNSTVFSSNDNGQNWTEVGNIAGEVDSLVYFNGYYVIVSSTGTSSTLNVTKDFNSWSSAISVPSFGSIATFPTADYFIIKPPSGEFLLTKDFSSWTTPQTGVTEYWINSFILSDGSIVLQGYYNISVPNSPVSTAFYKLSGNELQALPTPPFEGYSEFIQTETGFFFFDGTNYLYETSDFQSWVPQQIHAPFACEGNSFDRLYYASGNWVGTCSHEDVQQRVYLYVYQSTSISAVIWNHAYSTPGWRQKMQPHYYSGATGNSGFVLIIDGDIYTSSTGKSWTATANNYNMDNHTQLSSYGSLYFATTSAGQVYSSPDGQSWIQVNFQNTLPFGTIGYLPLLKEYYYGSQEGNIATSNDGVDWTITYTVPTTEYITSLVYNGKVLVATDQAAGVYVSA